VSGEIVATNARTHDKGTRRGAHAGPPAVEEPQPVRDPGSAWGLRPRSVRAKVVALLLVPVVSLMALWGFAAVNAVRSVDSGVRYRHVVDALLSPLGTAVAALQAERGAAGHYLAAPDPAGAQALRGSEQATDAALAALRTSAVVGRAYAAGVAPGLTARLAALDAASAGLPALRQQVTARQVDWGQAESAYDQTADAAFGVGGALTDVQAAQVPSDAHVLLEVARSGEMLAREDAAAQSAQAAGRFTPEQYQEFTGSAYARRMLLASAADLRGTDLARFQQLATQPGYRQLAAAEDAVRAAGPGRAALAAVPMERWNGAAAQAGQRVAQLITGADTENGNPYRTGLLSGSGIAVLLGLLAVIVSLVISVAVGRGLVVELVGLRDAALDLANRRLPDAMRRLRAGEEIDVAAETARAAETLDGTTGGRRTGRRHDGEIGEVAAALGSVQQAALQAAVERAEVLSGVSGVFVNLARRSQVLVHRQLTLLDAMERRTEEPSALEDLFKLDHLTTRMRRHAEGLIILSGAAPGRAWRRPVPLLDVVRAAVAEVEDYTRVEVRSMPESALVGTAVADVVHLLAELVENATGFSPPHTRVVVSGEPVGTGFALEIEDRGLGMGKEAMAEANRRIADAQQNALFDSDRLGLFVVSRLARRHGIRVSLRASAYGGTTAVVVVPAALLDSPRPAGTGGGRDAVAPEAGGANGGTRGVLPGLEPPGLELPGLALPGLPLPGLPRSGPVTSGIHLAGKEHAGNGNGAAPRRVPGATGRRVPHGGSSAGARGAAEPPDLTGLPRRVRQTHLAPQLRDEPPAAGGPPGRRGTEERGAGPRAPDRRSPEEARATMSALQSGWKRGRTGPTGPVRSLGRTYEEGGIDDREL
jgi:signal transduction histidine kinase